MGTLNYNLRIETHTKKKTKNLKNPWKITKNPKIMKLPTQPKTHALPPLLPQKLQKAPALHQKQKTPPPAQCFKLECAIQEKTTKNRHQTLFQFHCEDLIQNRFS